MEVKTVKSIKAVTAKDIKLGEVFRVRFDDGVGVAYYTRVSNSECLGFRDGVDSEHEVLEPFNEDENVVVFCLQTGNVTSWPKTQEVEILDYEIKVAINESEEN